MKMNKKIISLNLCFLLLFTACFAPISASSASPAYSVTVDGTSFMSNESKSGNGWSYDPASITLTLDGYNGSTIKASGDLVVYTKNEVTISGSATDKYSSDNCGIVVNGALTLNASDKTTISGANSQGRGGEGIVAASAYISSDYGTDFVVNGADGAYAIKANVLELSTKNLYANGGASSPAIFFSTFFNVLPKTNAEIISGGADVFAITYLKSASYSFDSDINVSFFDNNSRIIMSSKTGFMYGDVNEDTLINTKDVVLLAQSIAGWGVELSSKGEAAGDVAKDGTLNTKDVVKLAQFVADWDVTLGT